MTYKNWPKAETLNWDNVDASRTPPALPRWLYAGEIGKAEVGLTKESQQPKIALTIGIVESYEDAVDVGSGRRRQHETLTFSEKAMFRPKQLCEAMGIEPPASTSEDDLNEFAEQLVGENVWFIMSRREETYQGEKSIRNRVEAFVTEDELEEIAASMSPPDGESDAKPKGKAKGRSASKAGRNGVGSATNGRAAAQAGRRGREAVEEMDTDDEADDEADEEADEAEAEAAPAEAAPRRRGRPPKGTSARR